MEGAKVDNLKHYKLPDLVRDKLDDFDISETMLTEQDCVNEAKHELETMISFEAEGYAEEEYGQDHLRYRRQLTTYLARQRRRGIVPNGDYSYLEG